MGEVFNAVWGWLTSDSVLNAFTVFSFLISLATFVVMLRFKKRVRIEFDKRNFRKNFTRLIKEFSSMHDSLQDGLYSKDFLEKIDSILDELIAEYSFLSVMVKVRIRVTEFYIQRMCIPDAERGNTRRVHSLCKQLNHIIIYIRKED